MHHYGIIGNPLLHSFSAKYFNEKFLREHIDAEYSLYPIAEGALSDVEHYMSVLDGFNVTFPYKESIIPYLDRLDETAATIGAVNVVHERVGYNTDCLGFMESIRPLLRDYDKQALVLGTGGAAKAVCYGLKKMGISSCLVSRNPGVDQLGYDQLNEQVMDIHTIIVNCTPLGMLPDVDTYPAIPYELVTERHLLYDCVYNPEETVFLRKGRLQGAQTKNGIEMLINQAKAAWQIWNKKQ